MTLHLQLENTIIMVNCGMKSRCSTRLAFLLRMQSLITYAKVLRTFPKGTDKKKVGKKKIIMLHIILAKHWFLSECL